MIDLSSDPVSLIGSSNRIGAAYRL